jgi:hypothetical protein
MNGENMTRRKFSLAAVSSAVASWLGCKGEGPKPASLEIQAEREELAHGPLDSVWSNRLYFRHKLAPIATKMFPAFAGCGRCGLPWCLLRERCVNYSPSSGTFALCVDCWEELQISEHRIPYYRQVCEIQHADWLRYKAKYPEEPDPLEHWPALEKAIRAEDDDNVLRLWRVPAGPRS